MGELVLGVHFFLCTVWMISSLWGMNCFSLGDAFENCFLYFLHRLLVALWTLIPFLVLSQCPNLTTVHIQLMVDAPPEPLNFRFSVSGPVPILALLSIFISCLDYLHSSGILFLSIWAYPTYIAARLIFLCWIYMLLFSLKLCGIISLNYMENFWLDIWSYFLSAFCVFLPPHLPHAPGLISRGGHGMASLLFLLVLCLLTPFFSLLKIWFIFIMCRSKAMFMEL